MIRLPIYLQFDHDKLVGMVDIDETSLPSLPNFHLALGYQVLAIDNSGLTKGYKLKALGVVPDNNFKGWPQSVKRIRRLLPTEHFEGYSFIDPQNQVVGPFETQERMEYVISSSYFECAVSNEADANVAQEPQKQVSTNPLLAEFGSLLDTMDPWNNATRRYAIENADWIRWHKLFLSVRSVVLAQQTPPDNA
jgi:hypothetical protein